ncbi:hypothetical protein FOZ62_008728 [Perkinsus olseni]|uniref:Uncharacterized protein n=1 Tax=Perkinsus olseni TaxID=32597 RepID=A0A7J6S1D4_PEROL|nr:hypothetical protein FOZ62_008728 [Perkinsus olseni]
MAVRQFYPETVMEDATDPEDLALSGLWWSQDGNSLLLNYRGSDVYEIKNMNKVESTTTASSSSPASKGVVAVGTPNLRVYSGRRNEETFAKECCMLGGDRYVATGGDCGHVYIWDRPTQRLQRKIKADTFVVNCVGKFVPTLPYLRGRPASTVPLDDDSLQGSSDVQDSSFVMCISQYSMYSFVGPTPQTH